MSSRGKPRHSGARDEVRLPPSTRSKVVRLLEYLRERAFDSELTVEKALAECGIRDRGFSTYFLAVTGFTPRELLERERMRRARELLLRTDHPVWRIALEVGFVSPASFSRAFKRVVGVPPSAWRRAARLLEQEKCKGKM